MAQTIYTDLTPGLMSPTLHYSQGDVGTTFVVEIQSRFSEAIPDDSTVTIQATKPSGLGFSVEGTLSDTTATFTTTEDMTDEYGRFQAELVITDGTIVIGTSNFWMQGEKNPHPDDTTDGQQGSIVPTLTLLVERIEAAAESIQDLSVEAVTLDPGEDATATYDSDSNTITFGIPRGYNIVSADDGDGNITMTYS